MDKYISINLTDDLYSTCKYYKFILTRTAEGVDTEVEKLLRDAARGEAGVLAVQEFLKKYPGRVDARAGGPGGGKKTCLQVAAHQGQKDLCTLLLDAGASLRAIDEDGDTPLHYAAFGFVAKSVQLYNNYVYSKLDF